MLYERYQGQGQQYAQPNYAQGGATSANPQPDQHPSCGQADYRPQSDYSQQQPNYGQSQQPNYGQQQYSQSDYGQSDYAQTRYSQFQTGPSPQSGYGYASGGYGQQYGYQNQNGYPQGGQPYAPQYGWPEPLPYGYQPRNKMVAGLLGIFLGWLGVHNFYLGHYGKAVAQLLLTLIGSIFFGLGAVASFIWGFIEGVLILSSDYGSPWHRDAKGVELRE
ncbi:MAG: NINE protein [Bifidobacterium sp.]|nr:NINE protein [Bifidobacterium sp.]